MSLIRRLLSGFSKDYIELEIRGDYLNRRELKAYTRKIIDLLRLKFPNINLIDYWHSSYLEARNNPFLCFPGYVVRLGRADPILIKQECMKLEMDNTGKRIFDIDVYLSNSRKVSRKN